MAGWWVPSAPSRRWPTRAIWISSSRWYRAPRRRDLGRQIAEETRCQVAREPAKLRVLPRRSAHGEQRATVEPRKAQAQKREAQTRAAGERSQDLRLVAALELRCRRRRRDGGPRPPLSLLAA